MKIIKESAPSCINACESVCTPLAKAVGVYFMGGDPVPELCTDTTAFKCMINADHGEKCKSLLDYAQDELGFSVPRTSQQVDTACGARPAFDERPQEPTATWSTSENRTASANVSNAHTTTLVNSAVATEDGNTVPTQTPTQQPSTTTATTDAGLPLSGSRRSQCRFEVIATFFAVHVGRCMFMSQ